MVFGGQSQHSVGQDPLGKPPPPNTFPLQFIAAADLQSWRSNENKFRAGGHPNVVRKCIQCRSVRKVENHWLKPSLPCVSSSVSGVGTLHQPVLNQFQKEKDVAALVISYYCAKYWTQPNKGRIYCSSTWQGRQDSRGSQPAGYAAAFQPRDRNEW